MYNKKLPFWDGVGMASSTASSVWGAFVPKEKQRFRAGGNASLRAAIKTNENRLAIFIGFYRIAITPKCASSVHFGIGFFNANQCQNPLLTKNLWRGLSARAISFLSTRV